MDFMAHRRIALVLLVVVFGASALSAEARAHEKFSASTYYETDEKLAAAPKESTGVTIDPNSRYPDGYPNTAHHWNKATGKYDEETLPTNTSKDATLETTKTIPKDSTETTVDPNSRYPDGYPNTAHHWNKATGKYDEETLPTNTSKDAALETTKTTPKNSTETTVDPNSRYPDGYPNTAHHWNKATGKYDEETLPTTTTQKDTAQTVDPLVFDPVKGRYSKGYNPYSPYTQKTTTPTNGGTDLAAKTTGEDLQHRYETGYYPSSNGGTKLAAQNTQTTSLEGDLQHRYEQGYYPSSDYTQNGVASQPKSVSYSSYMGNFQSMPYPSSGVPFVASGAGCRTAYWAENPDVWPSFFTVKSTVGDAFGAEATSTYGQITILQALLKYGSDPYSKLLSSGCTALLNSYTRGQYPVSHMKVIEQFNAALVSKDAATAQALAFETDNVESISAGNACT